MLCPCSRTGSVRTTRAPPSAAGVLRPPTVAGSVRITVSRPPAQLQGCKYVCRIIVPARTAWGKDAMAMAGRPRPDDAPLVLAATLPPPPSWEGTPPTPRCQHSHPRLHPRRRHRRRHRRPRSPQPSSCPSASPSPCPSPSARRSHPARRRATPGRPLLRAVLVVLALALRPGTAGARAEARAYSAWQPVDR